jgi:hypothetical protein
VLQAQVKILQGIINLFTGGYASQVNTAVTAYQTAFGSGTSEVKNSSHYTNNAKAMSTYPESYYIPNITTTLNNQMRINASNPWMNYPVYFYDEFRNKGPLDLKNTAQCNSQTHPNGFMYDDKHITFDAPGNIQYGYVAASTHFAPPVTALGFAGLAQEISGTSEPQWQNIYFNGDDPVDQVNALWGMNLYYNR